MYFQTIVCFANSRKEGRRCVAGKALQRDGNGAWVRPVSRDVSRALSPATVAYPGGVQPAPLDIVQVPMHSPLPQGHQAENALVDETCRWIRAGKLAWDDIGHWIDTPDHLWALNGHSGGMLNNRVDAGGAVHSSLRLIRVPDVKVQLVAVPTQENPSRRMVAGEFVYHGLMYRLHVTDTGIEALCRALPGQCMHISDAVLCVSLGAPFHGHCYKLIASILFERRFS